MSGAEPIDKLIGDIGAWNAWRLAHPLVVPELSTFEFQGKDLTGADLLRVNLAPIYMNLKGKQKWLIDLKIIHG